MNKKSFPKPKYKIGDSVYCVYSDASKIVERKINDYSIEKNGVYYLALPNIQIGYGKESWLRRFLNL